MCFQLFIDCWRLIDINLFRIWKNLQYVVVYMYFLSVVTMHVITDAGFSAVALATSSEHRSNECKF